MIGNITRDGGTPSVESIAAELGSMYAAERAPMLLALQQTHGNRYVQRVVAGIQAKLRIGQPGDKYEQEADRVADAVMRMPELRVQRQVEPEEEEEEIQPKSIDGTAPKVTLEMGRDIRSIKGKGHPLSASERAFFEPHFGVDFDDVRVHRDTRAAHVARSVNARAFTFGHDVVFGAGQYSSGTSSGRKLLAHELTHVVQQGAAQGTTPMHAPVVNRTPRIGRSILQLKPRCNFYVYDSTAKDYGGMLRRAWWLGAKVVIALRRSSSGAMGNRARAWQSPKTAASLV